MSKINFVNEYDMTNDMLTEVVKASCRHGRTKRYIALTILLLVVLTVGEIALGANLPTYIVLIVFALILWSFCFVVVELIRVRQAMRTMSDRIDVSTNKNGLHYRIECKDDIVSISGNSKKDITLEPSDIKGVEQTKNFIVLFIKGAMILPINKSAFESGSLDDVKSFIGKK